MKVFAKPIVRNLPTYYLHKTSCADQSENYSQHHSRRLQLVKTYVGPHRIPEYDDGSYLQKHRNTMKQTERIVIKEVPGFYFQVVCRRGKVCSELFIYRQLARVFFQKTTSSSSDSSSS